MDTNKPIDLKSIYDIPNIEEYTDVIFNFSFANIRDETFGYEYLDVFRKQKISVEIIASVSTVFNKDKLHDILFNDDVFYVSWTVEEMLLPIKKTYVYRPLVDESQKNYKQ